VLVPQLEDDVGASLARDRLAELGVARDETDVDGKGEGPVEKLTGELGTVAEQCDQRLVEERRHVVRFDATGAAVACA